MKLLSQKALAEIVKNRRNNLHYTQETLSELTSINRVMIGKIERACYIPSIPQLEKLAEVLKFDINEIFFEKKPMVYTAFRGENLTPSEKAGVDHLFKMMLAAKQQIVLRRALHDEEL